MTDTIGTATMRADGTIVLQLRAVSGPILGDAELVYPPDHPQYAEVMKHLGGIAPGQEKAVAPWPE